MDLLDRSKRLVSLYEGSIRPIVQKWTPNRLASFNDDFVRLAHLNQVFQEPIRIGLLGAAGAGKSTLINAIAFDGQSILPVGGVGALTAQATKIKYSAEPYFHATYDPRSILSHIVAQLRGSMLHGKGKEGIVTGEAVPEQDLLEEAWEEVRERQQFMKKAALLIKGHQEAPIEPKTLIAVLEFILGRHPELPEQEFTPEDLTRIRRLASITPAQTSGPLPTYLKAEPKASPDFRADLKNHAAGFLAPVVLELEVGYPWELCDNNLDLFDLPGVGVSGDSFVTVTEEFIREKTDAVILVVNRSGIENSCRELLDSSAFLMRLLHSIDKPDSDPITLLVVSTRADDSVSVTLGEAEQDGKELSPEAVMLDYSNRTKALLHTQLANELRGIVETWSGVARDTANLAIAKAVEGAHYHVVSSTQYALLRRKSAIHRPFLTDENHTGIPDLNLGISQASMDHTEAKKRALAFKLDQVEDALQRWAKELRQQHNFAILPQERIAIMRVALREGLAPKTKEAQARLVDFRGVITRELHLHLTAVLLEGRMAADRDVRRYLAKLASSHWASLRATVVKGGVHYGKFTINLPKAFSDPLEAHLLPLWQKKVLGVFAERVQHLAQDLGDIVLEMANLAGPQDLLEDGDAVSGFAQQLRGDIAQLTTLLDGSSDELRETIQRELYRAIREPIRLACQRFVERGLQLGGGTKDRILSLFLQIVPEALEAAGREAEAIFKTALDLVADRTRNRLKPYAELQATVEGLLLPPMDPESVAKRERLCQEAHGDVQTLMVLLDRPIAVEPPLARQGA